MENCANSKRDNYACQTLALWGIAIAAIAVFANVHQALLNSWFIGQDFDHLILAQEKTLLSFLLTPIDVHLPLPLHRFFCWLVYFPLKMNFLAGLITLTLFLLLSAIYLHRLLNAIDPSPTNIVFVTLYLCNPYLLSLFSWWSAGLHRLPYLFCAIASCYYGFKYSKNENRNSAIKSLLLFALAFGFYEKALLIPFYLGALLACEKFVHKKTISKKALLLLAVMLSFCIIYLSLGLTLTPTKNHLGKHLSTILLTLSLGTEKSAYALSPILFNEQAALFIITFLIAPILYIGRKNPRIYTPLLLAFGLTMLSIAPLAISDRAEFFKPEYITLPRYYFENTFLILLMAKYIIPKPIANLTRLKTAFLIAALAGYASLSHQTSIKFTQTDPSFKGSLEAANYMANLKKSLVKLGNDPTTIRDQPLPEFLYVNHLGNPIPLSRVASTWNRAARFVKQETADYYVDKQGCLQKEI